MAVFQYRKTRVHAQPPEYSLERTFCFDFRNRCRPHAQHLRPRASGPRPPRARGLGHQATSFFVKSNSGSAMCSVRGLALCTGVVSSVQFQSFIQLPCGPSPPPCRLRSAFCVLRSVLWGRNSGPVACENAQRNKQKVNQKSIKNYPKLSEIVKNRGLEGSRGVLGPPGLPQRRPKPEK